MKILRQDRMRFDALYRLYRLGRIGIESVCDLMPTPAARIVTYFLRTAARSMTPMFCVPVGTRGKLPPATEVRLLMGKVEVLLLQHLSLLEYVPQKHPKATVCMFADAWDSLQRECLALEGRTQRVELGQQRTLLEYLGSRTQKIQLECTTPALDEAEAAQRLGIVALVDDDAEANSELHISLRAVAALMHKKGAISLEQATRLAPAFQKSESLGEIPSRLLIDYSPLITLSAAGVLDVLVELVGERIFIGRDALALIRGRIDELQLAVDAAELAAATVGTLRRGAVNGWFVADLQRPKIEGLPQLKIVHGETVEDSLHRAPLVNGFSYRQALLGNPDMRYVSSDYFTAQSPGNESVIHLEWVDFAQLERLQEELRSAEDRVVSLPSLVSSLEPSQDALKELARLGFTEALSADAVLALAVQFGGLEKDVPASILDNIEQGLRQYGMASQGAPLAALVLANIYASASSAAFLSELPGGLDSSILKVLGERSIHLGATVTPLFPELFMEFSVNQILRDPLKAFGPADEQDRFAWSKDTPIGRFWTRMFELASSNASLQAAFMRAVREIWLYVDEIRYPNGPDRVESVALLTSVFTRTQSIFHAELEAPAILSANWRYRPLSEIRLQASQVSLEEQIQTLAGQFVFSRMMCSEREFVAYENGERGEGISAEAVLLRAPVASVADAARTLAFWQGLHDGRAYALLMRFAETPSPELARAIARNAVVAPWRLVRDHSAYICAWLTKGRLGFPSSLDDLCELLSEPYPGSGWWDSRAQILRRRIEPEGFWNDRSDRFRLLEQASLIPGILVVHPIASRFVRKRLPFEAASAIARLGEPGKYPTALLMSDVYFLTVLASKRPEIVPSGNSEGTVGELLSQTLVSALDQTISERVDSVSFADVEGGLLRLCRVIVTSLASGSRRQASRDELLWLSYRLFQWLSLQLAEGVTGGEDADLRELALRCPPASPFPVELAEVLEPAWFDRTRFDHRLAGLLLALASADDLAKQVHLRSSRAPEKAPFLEALASTLKSLAERPLTEDESVARKLGDRGSRLGWAGPIAVPDLALLALIKIRPSLFFELTSEHRLRWISDLPCSGDDGSRVGGVLTSAIVSACLVCPELLSSEERTLFLASLARMPLDEAVQWSKYARLRLLGAGMVELEPTVRDEIFRALHEPLAAHVIGEYWVYVAKFAPERLEQEVRGTCGTIERYGKNVELSTFFLSLYHLAVKGGNAASGVSLAVLEGLRCRQQYRNKLQIRRVIRWVRTLIRVTLSRGGGGP